MYLRYKHNVKAGHGHLHACMQIDHRQLQALGTYTLASHTLSAKGVASESTYIIGIYNIYFYVQQ